MTDAGEAVAARVHAARWAIVATRWRDALPRGLRTADGGVIRPRRRGRRRYPLRHRVAGAREAAAPRRPRSLGPASHPTAPSPPWTAPLAPAARRDTERTRRALLPAEVDRIYLQADLTAIAPGPLASALDLRLRTIADRESRAQASTYRFTHRVDRAPRSPSGETARVDPRVPRRGSR